MKYTVEFSRQATHDLADAPAHLRPRLIKQVMALRNVPHPPAATELREPYRGKWRIRVDKWRIIYEVDADERVVYIQRIKLKTGPETYRDLE